MLNTTYCIERFLQNYRFALAKQYLKGDVLDFGGNNGELGRFVLGKYVVVNYDHTIIENHLFDTIVMLAVIEHLYTNDVSKVFSTLKKHLKPNGSILLTTPTPCSHKVLVFMAQIGLLDKKNIDEHKHYWQKSELFTLTHKTGFIITHYKKFQLGFNQFAVLKHK